jgi:hypothetical protein
MTITLPPEIEGPLAEQARLHGTTPEALAVESLRRLFNGAPASVSVPPPEGESMYDHLKDYIGIVSGTGESFSENCGNRFTEGLLEKKRHGHL